MYAVVKTGGKQYRVSKDDTILVEKLNAEEGETITLNEVILLGNGEKITIGKPMVADACVEAKVVSQTRGPKILMLRRKRRKNHRRLQGHRQDLTLLKITDILTSGNPSPKKTTEAKTTPKTKTAPAKTAKTKAKTAKSTKAAPKTAKTAPKTAKKTKSDPKQKSKK